LTAAPSTASDRLAQAHDTFLAAEGEGLACDEEDALARPTELGDETKHFWIELVRAPGHRQEAR